LDLLGGHFIGRQGRVQLVIGDIAALLALLDELLQLGAEGVEKGGVGALLTGFGGFGLTDGCGFGRHFFSWSLRQTGPTAKWAVKVAARRGRGRAVPQTLPFYYMGHKCKER